MFKYSILSIQTAVFKLFQLGERSEEYRLRSTELQTTLENVVVSFVHFHRFHRYMKLYDLKKTFLLVLKLPRNWHIL